MAHTAGPARHPVSLAASEAGSGAASTIAWVGVFAAILSGGCALPSQEPSQPPTAKPTAPATSTLRGTVVYRERMALPGKVVVKVTLEDVSLADAPSKVIAEQVLTDPKGPPYAFSLSYDAAKIAPSNRYTLRASITADGRLMFSSTEHIPAFSAGPSGQVEILTRRTRM